MFLSITAALLQGLAFIIYLRQVRFGSSTPNPASWTVWAFLAVLNALTFWKASGDMLATMTFFTGGVMCTVVFVYSLFAGKFSKLDNVAKTSLIIGLVACFVWWKQQDASYANILVAFGFAVSSWPTLQGVWQDSRKEKSLPWFIWTAAFTLTLLNVILRWKGQSISLLMPTECVIIHGVVATLAVPKKELIQN